MPTNQEVTEEQIQRMASAYADGKTCREIGRAEGLHYVTVGKKLRAAGVLIEPAGRRRKRVFTAEEEALMVEWSASGVIIEEMTRRLKASPNVTGRALRALGIVRRTHDRHWSWKGGRVRTGEGYIWARPADGEFPEMRNRQGYILEHRLMMARSLGRPLTRRETVHHRNGQRDDNRLENLELRLGAHGKGQAYRCADCGSLNIVLVAED